MTDRPESRNGGTKRTLKEQFQDQDSERWAVLERAEEASRKTLPHVFPVAGQTQDSQSARPFSSQAAQGIVRLASRLTSAVIPFNGTPFFEFHPPQPQEKTPETDEVVEALTAITTASEDQILQDLYSSNLRVELHEAMIHLQVTGNYILKMHDDLTFQGIPLINFVATRDGAGRLVQFLYKELVDPQKMPEGTQDFAKQGQPRPNSLTGVNRPWPANRHLEELFTKYTFDTDTQMWEWEQEFREEKVSEGSRKNNNCMVLRWGLVAGENYGRSKCDEVMGDIRSAEGLARSLMEQSAAAARGLILVNPGGFTNIDDLADTQNWDMVAGRGEDLEAFSVNLNPQIASTHASLAFVEQKISEAFLMITSSANAGRDRVTATENRMNAQQLEQGLSGFISQLASDVQIPLVFNRLEDMEAENPDDLQLRALREVLEANDVGVQIKTGLDALGRELDHARLLELLQISAQLPPEGQAFINWPVLISELTRTSGLSGSPVVRSEEEVAQIQATQQRAAQDQAAFEAGLQTARNIPQSQPEG